MKRQIIERENVFDNYISDKRLRPRIYKQVIQFNNKKKTNKKTEKAAKDLNSQLTKENRVLANKHVKDVQHHQLLNQTHNDI